MGGVGLGCGGEGVVEGCGAAGCAGCRYVDCFGGGEGEEGEGGEEGCWGAHFEGGGDAGLEGLEVCALARWVCAR